MMDLWHQTPAWLQYAVLTAPLLIRHHVPQGWLRRAGVAVLGLSMVAGFMALTGLLPDDVADNDVMGFLLALAMGYVGLALAPYLARVLDGADGPGGEAGANGTARDRSRVTQLVSSPLCNQLPPNLRRMARLSAGSAFKLSNARSRQS
jgi:hypothetical protein